MALAAARHAAKDGAVHLVLELVQAPRFGAFRLQNGLPLGVDLRGRVGQLLQSQKEALGGGLDVDQFVFQFLVDGHHEFLNFLVGRQCLGLFLVVVDGVFLGGGGGPRRFVVLLNVVVVLVVLVFIVFAAGSRRRLRAGVHEVVVVVRGKSERISAVAVAVVERGSDNRHGSQKAERVIAVVVVGESNGSGDVRVTVVVAAAVVHFESIGKHADCVMDRFNYSTVHAHKLQETRERKKERRGTVWSAQTKEALVMLNAIASREQSGKRTSHLLKVFKAVRERAREWKEESQLG